MWTPGIPPHATFSYVGHLLGTHPLPNVCSARGDAAKGFPLFMHRAIAGLHAAPLPPVSGGQRGAGVGPEMVLFRALGQLSGTVIAG